MKKKTTPKRRYSFHVVDVEALQRERDEYAERTASGAYSVETYKDRLAMNRAPAAKLAEKRRVRKFNAQWKRKRKGYTCVFPGCHSRALFPKPNTVCNLHNDPERDARLNEYRKQSLAPIQTNRRQRGKTIETNALMT